MKEYVGLLAHIAEAADLQQQLRCTAGEAFELQRELLAIRMGDDEPESNVVHVDFRKQDREPT